MLNRRRAIISGLFAYPSFLLMGGCSNRSTDSYSDLSIVTRLIELQLPLSNVDHLIYKDVALNLIKSSAKDQDLEAALSAATAALRKTEWTDKSKNDQISQLQALEKEPWFFLLSLRANDLFFQNPKVWTLIEYDGPSLEKGGYIDRGFNTIDWLPEASE